MSRSTKEPSLPPHARLRIDALRKVAERALHEAAWDTAESSLVEMLARDTVGDVRILPLFRKLEEGRGTRANALRRVVAFVDAHPTLAHDPYVRLERGLALRMTGERRAARDELLPARDALLEIGDLKALSVAENCIGLTYLAPLDARRARRAFRAARQHAEAGGLYDRIGSADTNLAMVELQSGNLEEASRAHRRALRAYELARDARGEMLACHNLGNCLLDLGRDRASLRYLRRAETLARERKDLWILAWTVLVLGELARKAGRLDEAGLLFDEAEETFGRVGGPSATESAWLCLRRADVAFDRGDVRKGRRLARNALTEGVEQTPRLHARLLRAKWSTSVHGTAARARELERVAHEAELATLAELAWRARACAARLFASRAVDALLDAQGVRTGETAARAAGKNLDLAKGTLDRVLGTMRAQDRRSYLRDRARRDDASFVLLGGLFGIAGGTTPRAPAVREARAENLRVLTLLGEVTRSGSPIDAAARGLAAILDVAQAESGYLWIDATRDAAALHAARDVHGRELPARPRPLEGRILHKAGRAAGLLTLEGAPPNTDEDTGSPLVDAVSSIACALIDASRTRAELLARAEAQAEDAQRLAIDLARMEVALGEARSRLEERGDEPRVDRRGAMIGRSRPMRDLFARLDRLRTSELPVLVTGESGTGKELVARALHDESARSAGPFVAVNCGALAEALLESELFGHVRGAFTGADRDAPGLFLVAHGGTLLLDEVGEMSLGMQAKLLRVLQESEIRPVGSPRTRQIDVRIVAATHRDLEQRVSEGRFREDLYYRLHVLTVHVPPLRARGDDVLLLAREFLSEGAAAARLTPAAAAWLLAQAWTGNVRELRAVVESARVLSGSDLIDAHMFAPIGRAGRVARRARANVEMPERLDELEAWAIERALSAHGGSCVLAAKALGVGRATLYRKLALYGIARTAK